MIFIRSIILIGIVCTALLAGAAPAHAGGRDDFNRAYALEKDGKHAEALAALKALAGTGGEFGDDALLEAGRIYEEELLDGAQAAEMYTALLRDFPNSRLQRRAAARLEALRTVEPRFLKPALEFRRAILDYPRDNKAAMERVQNLIQRTPDYPGADHAYYWLGEVSRGKGDTLQAERYYHTVIEKFPQSAWAWKARRSLGDLSYDLKEYAAAADLYREAAAAPDPSLKAAALNDVERSQTHVVRHRISNLSFLALALGWIFLIAGIRRLPMGLRTLVRPVAEAWVMLVFALAILAVTAVFQRALVAGIGLTLLVFIFTIQLSGVLLRNHSFRAPGKIAYLVFSIAIMAGVLYGAVVKMGHMGSLIHTFRFGF